MNESKTSDELKIGAFTYCSLELPVCNASVHQSDGLMIYTIPNIEPFNRSIHLFSGGAIGNRN